MNQPNEMQIVIDNELTVRLSLDPIDNLIGSARNGFRLYELFRLAVPQDLVHYVDIEVITDTPERHAWWPEGSATDERPQRWQTSLSNPPWTLFGGDSTTVRTAWNESGLEEQAANIAAARWSDVEAAQAEVRAQTSPLSVYELALIDTHQHPNDLALLEENISPYLDRYFRFRPRPHFADSAYPLIADLLAHPAIQVFSHRGRGDWFAIQLACAEQIRRRGDFPTRGSEIFPVRVLSGWSGNSCFDWDDDMRVSLSSYPAWSAGVRFQYEGIEIAGLFLDDHYHTLGATNYASGEKKQLKPDLLVIVTTYPGPDFSPKRQWFSHESGLHIGIAPTHLDSFHDLIERNRLLAV